MSFSNLGLSPEIVRGVRAMGYTEPTAIQAKAIAPILAGRDLIGCAQTGTGKTAAFVLPILNLLRKNEPGGIRALVLTPTRELAAQVETAVRDYSRFTTLQCAVVYGGVAIGPQENRLKQGIDILVATPGRLLDHIERGNVFCTTIRILVLDEADRMVDMGFAPDLNRILRKLPAGRQTLMFSATMPPELNAIAKRALVEPVRVEVAPKITTAAGIRQAVYPVSQHLKTDLLLELLEAEGMESVLVFARTKHGADRIARHLDRRGHSVASLHSNRTQGQRERALHGFRSGQYQVLVATDIASRGLDVEGISHVINYDVPHAPEDYVHRVGRTARASAVGDAFTLMSRDEESYVAAIERFTGKSIPRVTIPDFDYKRAAPSRDGRGGAAPERGERRRRSGRGERGRHREADRGPRRDDAPLREAGDARHDAARAASHAPRPGGPQSPPAPSPSPEPAGDPFGRSKRQVHPLTRRRR
jgi:ATP-dependent RNA helicase RhlE